MAGMMAVVPPEIVFLQWLITEAGYSSPKIIPGGRWAAIIPKMFTHAIAIGPLFDYCSITTSWCYETREEAKAALVAWTGYGEPAGWIRHPDSGRRVARSENEFDENDRPVPIGEVYVRA
jgi:hypothetical protein